ncbi:MAG: hypothetical protein A2176_00745 [Spirochaetes bacterium RBG_13_51_14]|nr:MAG: hypothetical protein A2176_00745 [Spirochaetes bacterium RBG_13_51_14]
MEKSKIITWDVKDRIGLLTIDNPPQNYLAEPDFMELGRLREWTGDAALRGIIISGNGRHFSAGANLETLRLMARDERHLLTKLHQGRELLDWLENVEIPVLASISGACFGGGLEIALACHIRVCGKNALFAFPEINHCLMPGLGGTVRLPGRIGFSSAVEMILSGDIVNADRALEIGLVDHVVASREAFNFSYSLMKKMVDGRSSDVITSVVRAVNNSRTMSRREAMEEETKMFCRLAKNIHE